MNQRLQDAIEDQTAVLGVVGLGYVGLPLALEFARSGFRTVGFDTAGDVVAAVNDGRTHVQDVDQDILKAFVGEGLLAATDDFSRLEDCDAIAICVPTPLNKIKDPDLSYVVDAASAVRDRLRPGQLVILESTTYPGTTREIVLPLLEESGLTVGEDFHLCFSPERVDPGNAVWHTRNTPKVLGGVTPACTDAGKALYDRVFDTIVPVESAEAAELVKVYENTFRMIDIALANELAQVADRLGVDVWGVIEAAATKPFGFMKFTPGPGLGGHCIPLDPHYLSWKMKSLAYKTRLIELASEINGEMPEFVVDKIGRALNEVERPIRGSRVLILGVAYKKNINDLRESPAIEVIQQLQQLGAVVEYHDPHCPVILDDGHTPLRDLPLRSVPLTADRLRSADAVAIIADHDAVDYELVVREAGLVVDTRGVIRTRFPERARVVPLAGPTRNGRLSDAPEPRPLEVARIDRLDRLERP